MPISISIRRTIIITIVAVIVIAVVVVQRTRKIELIDNSVSIQCCGLDSTSTPTTVDYNRNAFLAIFRYAFVWYFLQTIVYVVVVVDVVVAANSPLVHASFECENVRKYATNSDDNHYYGVF